MKIQIDQGIWHGWCMLGNYGRGRSTLDQYDILKSMIIDQSNNFIELPLWHSGIRHQT